MNKINHQLLHHGPIRTEARRLAKEAIKAELNKRKFPINNISDKQWENLVTVLLWNTGDQFLTVAKWNLEERK